MGIDLDIAKLLSGIWLIMRSWIYLIKKSWPLRVRIIKEVSAVFLYPYRRCHVEIIIVLHPRISLISLGSIRLELKDGQYKQSAIEVRGWKSYIKLDTTQRKKLTFIYDNFTDNQIGRVIIEANNHKCASRWFPIKLINKKEDVPPWDELNIKHRKIRIL